MKKILIPQIEAGAGHKMPALAIKEAIERLYPGEYQVDVVDFAKDSGALKDDRKIKGAWDFALAHAWGAKIGYLLADRLWPFSMFWFRHLYPEFRKKAREFVAAYQPDIILATNFAAATVAALARRDLKLPVKVGTFVTDPFDAYGWWIDKNLDFLWVASDKARDQVVRRGFPAAQVKVIGFPIHQKFFNPGTPEAELRSSLGLKPGLPVILTSEGGQGIGKISGFVLRLQAEGFPCNVISVCAKNTVLKEELETLERTSPTATHLVPLGFVSNMNELLGIADLCVAKAGASTTFEALLKNAPIIFTSWATYSEKPNIDFCVEKEVGWYTPTYDAFRALLDNLLHQGGLQAARERLSALRLHSGNDEAARGIVDMLEGRIQA